MYQRLPSGGARGGPGMRFSISDNTQRLERNKILKGSSGDGTVMYSFFTSLPASTVGTICGIGGGVIIKPVLDID